MEIWADIETFFQLKGWEDEVALFIGNFMLMEGEHVVLFQNTVSEFVLVAV
jgi:hypothetical protein